jgi:hypothetical protein
MLERLTTILLAIWPGRGKAVPLARSGAEPRASYFNTSDRLQPSSVHNGLDGA